MVLRRRTELLPNRAVNNFEIIKAVFEVHLVYRCINQIIVSFSLKMLCRPD